MTERELTALFAAMNGRYFGGRLPTYRVRWCKRFPKVPEGEAVINLPTGGWCDRRRRVILLRRELDADRQELIQVFVHEMAHVVVGGGHGEAHTREMRRLKCLGAPVSDEDVTPMFNFPLTRTWVENRARDCLRSRGITFAQFSRTLASGKKKTPTELLRRYPWIRSAFQRVRKEERRIGTRQEAMTTKGEGR